MNRLKVRFSEFSLKTYSRAHSSIRNYINNLIHRHCPPAAYGKSSVLFFFIFKFKASGCAPLLFILTSLLSGLYHFSLRLLQYFPMSVSPFLSSCLLPFIVSKHHVLHVTSLYLLLTATRKKFKLHLSKPSIN